MNDKKPHKKEKDKLLTLKSALTKGTGGVAGASAALAKANKLFQRELKKVKDSRIKSPHKD